ncbi:ATP-binding cassette domain-containing protein [Candidatus Nanopelagicales bacterium]|nr:ATP-binding cassette domain-containing protein [Candidatus Nanopelagicales bacterium]
MNLAIHAGDRIKLAGGNGTGKSTIAGLLAGTLAPDSGKVLHASGVSLNVLDQGRSLPETGSALAAAVARAQIPEVAARSLLAKFGLGADDVAKACDQLSPGERTRLQLAVMSTSPAALLILDEPTNHLDLAAIEQLEQALTQFRGAVLFITHDARLDNSFPATVNLRVGPDGGLHKVGPA